MEPTHKVTVEWMLGVKYSYEVYLTPLYEERLRARYDSMSGITKYRITKLRRKSSKVMKKKS